MWNVIILKLTGIYHWLAYEAVSCNAVLCVTVQSVVGTSVGVDVSVRWCGYKCRCRCKCLGGVVTSAGVDVSV